MEQQTIGITGEQQIVTPEFAEWLAHTPEWHGIVEAGSVWNTELAFPDEECKRYAESCYRMFHFGAETQAFDLMLACQYSTESLDSDDD